MMIPCPVGLTNAIACYIFSPITGWLPITLLAGVAMILLLGIIYALSGLMGRTELRVWVRVKIYDVLMSIVLIFLFYFFFITFFNIDPMPMYKQVNLVPSGCKSIIPANSNFYSLAACDMFQFLQQTLTLATAIYFATISFSLAPTITVTSLPLLAPLCGSEPFGCGIQDTFSVIPITPLVFTGDLLGAFYPLFALNEVQLLLLSSALLIFSVFMAIGLIARFFVISRTFGGTLIAFAIGIGLLYPVLVSFTYGFITVGVETNTGPGLFINYATSLINPILSFIVAIIPGVGVSGLGWLSTLIVYIGFMFTGLTVIPLLNFVVLDTFIIDFSRVVGERMDLTSLLTAVGLV